MLSDATKGDTTATTHSAPALPPTFPGKAADNGPCGQKETALAVWVPGDGTYKKPKGETSIRELLLLLTGPSCSRESSTKMETGRQFSAQLRPASVGEARSHFRFGGL